MLAASQFDRIKIWLIRPTIPFICTWFCSWEINFTTTLQMYWYCGCKFELAVVVMHVQWILQLQQPSTVVTASVCTTGRLVSQENWLLVWGRAWVVLAMFLSFLPEQSVGRKESKYLCFQAFTTSGLWSLINTSGHHWPSTTDTTDTNLSGIVHEWNGMEYLERRWRTLIASASSYLLPTQACTYGYSS